jgi:hypothetical protein
MAFTQAEKVDIRRFLGFPAYGIGPSGFQGWRFWQSFGLVEFRLNNMDPTEETVVRNTYLNNLYTLEADIVGARSNLDTDQAAVWKHNKTEVAERVQLYNYWRREFCNFLGAGTGPSLKSGTDLVV